MLKGKMTIELTDVKSGEKDVIEEENMVTNALANIFAPLGHLMNTDTIYNQYNSYYAKLLGGLLLFDNNIEENADQLFPPANANLVGCAVYNTQNNTTGKMRGGYNQTESEFNSKQKYMKFVYDFTTSQANGVISCVALTHQMGGYTSYGSSDAVNNNGVNLALTPYNSTLHYAYPNCTGASTGDKYSGCTVGTTELLFLLDPDNDTAYYFKIKSANKITIIKRRIYLKSVSIFENPYSQKALIEETELDDLATTLATNYISYNFDVSNNCLYIFTCSAYSIKPNESWQVTRIKLSDYSIRQWVMTNTTNEQISTNGTRFAFANNGFVYLKGYNSPYELYKFEIGNAANVVKIKRSGMSTIDGWPVYAINGRIYYQYFTNDSNRSHVYVVNEETNECLKTEAYCTYTNNSNTPCFTPVLNHPMILYCSYGSWSTGPFFILANYLATINNLSESVTKTADKTMKITYTIQEQ